MHSSDTTKEPATLLLAALEFAARKHSRQRRKDLEATPYINHPIEVAEVLSRIGGITELPTLQAAILHDTIEDTGTTPQELEDYFGQEVRLLVQEVTDEKSLPNQERKRLQIEHAPNLSPPAKLIKNLQCERDLADATSQMAVKAQTGIFGLGRESCIRLPGL